MHEGAVKIDNEWVCYSDECPYCPYGVEIGFEEFRFVGIPDETDILVKLPSRAFKYYDTKDSLVRNNIVEREGERWVFETVKQICKELPHKYYAIQRIEADIPL